MPSSPGSSPSSSCPGHERRRPGCRRSRGPGRRWAARRSRSTTRSRHADGSCSSPTPSDRRRRSPASCPLRAAARRAPRTDAARWRCSAPHSPRSEDTTRTRRPLGGLPLRRAAGGRARWRRASSVSMLVISVEYGRAAWTRACALAIRDVAISSWALVIFLIDPAERMRPRSSRSVAAMWLS